MSKTYWFPAKRYGWGWGWPSTWQGLLVMAIYFAVLGGAAFVFIPARDTGSFLLVTFAATAVLVVVCYLKGEPPSWRWGGD